MAFESEIDAAVKQTGVPREMLLALIRAESAGNPKAVSKVGAQGLTQLMPETARSVGVEDPFDPGQNIMGGAKYLKSMMDQFKKPELALAAYNAGPGNVRKYGGIPPFKETQNYVNKILGMTGGSMGQNMKAPDMTSSMVPGASGGGGDLASLLKGAMKPSTGDKVGAVLGGLSEVVASLNRNNGAEYQQRAASANMARRQMATQEKQTGLSQILSLMKGDSTDDIKEFEYAKKKGFGGSFEDFLKIKPSAQSGSIPGIEGIYPLLVDKIKKQLGADAGKPPAPTTKPIELDPGFSFTPG